MMLSQRIAGWTRPHIEGGVGIADRYPREWRNDARLGRWHAWHCDPDSGVWAVRPREWHWDLYAPCTPGLAAWVHGDPHADAEPRATLSFDTAERPRLPFTVVGRQLVWHRLEQLAGGQIIDHIEGLRAEDATWKRAYPIAYLRVAV
ncbi:hypothetical protein I0C86_40725 [Plantactinospora sp. S1510]|uniref:Uncharacterized protein n=1 Tax=Plantactinospora alkalitolerans TaxID=2789879 RepID=A0ABS0H9R1_9ACTN|nr:hypothetical protein [Plantactinospora alkalitolerans]MBF9135206.1 hypothetical protein [Plantactinospora alkalitolerans]